MIARIDSGVEAGLTILGVLGYFWGAIITIVFVYIAWRAMRAHERIAEALERRASTHA